MCDWYDVGDLRVLGKLERRIARELLEGGFNERNIQVHDRSFNYEVDFVISNVVIEAKGRIWGRCVEKGKKFMEQYGDEYTYIVVGQDKDTRTIPCHRWYSHENCKEMVRWISQNA